MMGNKTFIFRFGDFEVREREFSLVRAGEALQVEPKAFRALVFLLHNPQRLIAKEELVKSVWGDTSVADGSVTRCIWLLRRLLGDDINEPRYIETVATVGYRFVCKVEVAEETSVDSQAIGETSSRIEQEPARNSADQNDQRKSRLRGWLQPSIAVLAIGLVFAVWNLSRLLPPLQVTNYTRLTYDGKPKELAGTDGNRIYFNQHYYPQPLAQISTSGGEIAPIPVQLQIPWMIHVAPDGSNLTVLSYKESGTDRWSFWSVQLPGGSLRRLSDFPKNACFSPDGKIVAYKTDDGINLTPSDGSAVRKLSLPASNTGSTGIDGLTCSPDGSTLRFIRDHKFWELSSNGSGLHLFMPGWHPNAWQSSGSWTPDGKFFVFLLQETFFTPGIAGSQLWALDERRGLLRKAPTEPVQLTSGPIQWSTPIFSKDGKKIFARGVVLHGELLRFDAKAKELKAYLGGISAEFVTFSPDGKFVAYVTFPQGILWRANRDGSNPIQLTQPPLYPIVPRWSPDGTNISFTINEPDRYLEYIIPSQGGTPQALFPQDKGGQVDANYSPDGRKIVFTSIQYNGNARITDFRILDVASKQISLLPGSQGLWSPRWSPNGRFIEGSSYDSGFEVFDIEKQRWTKLREIGGEFPTWSSDSKYIYFEKYSDMPNSGIYRIRVSDGAMERIIDLQEFHSTGAVENWFGLDPTDTPLVLHNTGTDDIFALTLEAK
jgi:DNA-binding winged helix-turn-helix (wHTH) protein/Tol biopolymer transport system component